jgi:hypothetical protein
VIDPEEAARQAAEAVGETAPPSEDIHPHAPGFAVADTPMRGQAPLPDAEEFIERAIEKVLEQVPEVVDEEPEGSAKLQPWAETAAPPSKNKRPLSELLEQYAARVAAAPDAVAGRPRGQHPIAAFFARFTPQGGGRGAGADVGGGGGGGRRKRRGRRGAAEGRGGAQPQQRQATTAPAGTRPQRGPGQRPEQRQPRPESRQPRPDQRQPRPQASRPPEGTPPDGAAQGAPRSGRRRRRRRGGGGGGGGAAAPG